MCDAETDKKWIKKNLRSNLKLKSLQELRHSCAKAINSYTCEWFDDVTTDKGVKAGAAFREISEHLQILPASKPSKFIIVEQYNGKILKLNAFLDGKADIAVTTSPHIYI